ncbi:signal peptide peptidase (macronuclear) [Tetrahymena thermophila SB210]|uniref:Signal peptide peptidase n=1 Tax=Tetrahymena thermophila (strain SB210) TaxID=312017 RepID=Q22EC6_TETTS|nr:signal peptide peptidase [Tetrahymena thermophila SB210]EAR83602.2 signal peptide peptidase [Tetrahymena thermophila SB210]|eukprot:XP_001031265.2 signal peptide peptidase [Tetrahymena thermophila SB210]
MTTVKSIIRPERVVFASLLIILVHVVASLMNTPASIQLILNSVTCVYIGCFLTFRVERKHNEEFHKRSLSEDAETMTSKDAFQFPLYGSLVLFGIYVLYKFLPKEYLSFIFTSHFMFIGIFCVGAVFEIPFSAVFQDKYEKVNVIKRKININLPLLKKEIDLDFNLQQIICIALALIPTVSYILSRNWIANNIFGIAFSVMGINNLVLPNFKVGYILMWGLFFYDIFWVYGTDVMVTVAKSFDAPIKLIFPFDWENNKHSMLGLGDIVIPGVFVALALKYDIDQQLKKAINIHAVKTPYFNWCFGGYIAGIITTFVVMVVFNHPQPALLFLVPGCTISVLIKALLDGKLKELFLYEESEKGISNTQAVQEQKAD